MTLHLIPEPEEKASELLWYEISPGVSLTTVTSAMSNTPFRNSLVSAFMD